MFIKDIYKSKKSVISLEIFPPKKSDGIETIYETIEELSLIKPDFISVTYSAGGSGKNDRTIDIASLIKNKYKIESLAHLTCINSSSSEIEDYINKLKANNVENIMALRGDLPDNTATNCVAGDFKYAKDLINEIKRTSQSFCIGAAAYPEGHIDCDSLDVSIEHLKQKVDAGADFLITQLFFDNNSFYNFYEKALSVGINIPISAGIIPILSRSQIQKMIFMCGASLPVRIIKILNKYEDDPSGLRDAAIEYSSEQINDLVDHGVSGVHIYTMNRSEIALRNIANLKYRR